MAKHGKMHKAVMGILATMFVASLVLAVVSFVWPAPVKADFCYKETSCKTYGCVYCCKWRWVCCDWQGCKYGDWHQDCDWVC
jgi:hypothetical protein